MNQKHWQAIFWDFDGVLMNSNEIRDAGFSEVLNEFPKEQVDALLKFHRKNGGLSRYVKFRYFFENIRKEEIAEEGVTQWAQKFSEVMLKNLVNAELLIAETLNFVKKNENTPMHIVSGSDQKELRFLCTQLHIDQFFSSIHGSPTPKKELVRLILTQQGYAPENCILVGDSINDYEAAQDNGVAFQAYNNKKLEQYNTGILNF